MGEIITSSSLAAFFQPASHHEELWVACVTRHGVQIGFTHLHPPGLATGYAC